MTEEQASDVSGAHSDATNGHPHHRMARACGELAALGHAQADDTAGPGQPLRVPLPAMLAGRVPAGVSDDPDHDLALADLVLRQIAAGTPLPQLPAWARYAAEVTSVLLSAGHPQRLRAVLAHLAVAAGMLGREGRDDVTGAAVAAVLTEDLYLLPSERGVIAWLQAWLGLHLHGYCEQALTGVRHTPLPPQPAQWWPDRMTALAVTAAMLGMCGRTEEITTLLSDLAPEVPEPGGAGRELVAGTALALADRLYPAHDNACTDAHRRPYDRHRLSALLHGDPADRHRAGPPIDPPPPRDQPSAGGPAPALDDVVTAFSAHAAWRIRAAGTRPQRCEVYLVCHSCSLALSLGITTVTRAAPHQPSAAITNTGRYAWQYPPVARALWRMLAEHTGHLLRVVTEASPVWRTYWSTPTDMISFHGRPVTTDPDITLLDGWLSHGAADTAAGHVVLACLGCRLELDAGHLTPGYLTTEPGVLILDAYPAWDLPAVTTAVFRMLTEHAGHDLMLFDTHTDAFGNYRRSGQGAATITRRPRNCADITHEQYAHGWPDQPTRRHFRGTDPIIAPTDNTGTAPR